MNWQRFFRGGGTLGTRSRSLGTQGSRPGAYAGFLSRHVGRSGVST